MANSRHHQGSSGYFTADPSTARLLQPQFHPNSTSGNNVELTNRYRHVSDVDFGRSTISNRNGDPGSANDHNLDNVNGSDAARNKALPSEKEWRSWKVTAWFRFLMFLLHFGFIAALFVVAQFSVRQNGLVELAQFASSSDILQQFLVSQYTRYYSLLWVSLPAFIFSLYVTAIATVVAGSYERQPYVDLYYGNNARRTIMLDYRAYPLFYNYIVAFKQNHVHLGCAMLLAFIASTIITPLSAHLFVAEWTVHNSTGTVSYAAQFNDSVDIGTTNLQPFIDISTAVHAYSSSPPPWMTTEYAFVPFAAVDNHTYYANLSAHTDAYSAYLECDVIDSSNYTSNYNSGGVNAGSELGTATFEFNDRLCAVKKSFAVANNTPTYAISWQANCQGQTVGRIGMFAATYSASAIGKLSGRSIVSCIPSYWHSEGILTVARNSPSSLGSNYISFYPNSSNRISPDPVFSRAFEVALQQYTIFNPAAATNANAFGFAILSAANTAAKSIEIVTATPEIVRDATSLVFSTIYAGLATSKLLVPSQAVTDKSATLSNPVQKLCVSGSIAYTIAAILTLTWASHVMLWRYASTHRSILTEEPKGLISTAILLEGDDIKDLLSKVRATSTGNISDVRKTLMKEFTTETSGCNWDPDRRQIVITGLTRKPAYQA